MFGERAADVLAGIPHVIRLGVAGGAASVVTEADAFEELRIFPGFGFGQNDSDLDVVRLIHDAHVPESTSILRRQAST